MVDLNWMLDSPFEQVPTGDPGDLALVLDGRSGWTYRELRDHRDGYVGALTRLGIGPGDRVGILMLNSLEYVALYFAIARIGAIAVRLNFRLTSGELAYIIGDSGCRAVVLHASRLGQVEPLHDTCGVEHWLVIDDDGAARPSWAPVLTPTALPEGELARPRATDPVMLMYTSGTTGLPKGVVWTHQSALWLASMQSMKWRFSSRTVAMTTGPLYHAGAFELFLLPALLTHGSGVVMSSGGMDTSRIVTAIRDAGATHVILYPFLLYGLLRDTWLVAGDLATLELVLVGGDPVLPWALEAMAARFPAVAAQQGYGLTEATMSTCLDSADLARHPDSVGRPMPLARVRVLDEDGRPASAGTVGEVWISSPAVAAGYWNNAQATAATFVDGWCRTGDLGRVTEDGFLVLTGRQKDMIRSGGENIYPAEVERVLSRHPAVEYAAVVAVPDERYLEVGCAVVVPRDGRPPPALEAELRDLAREHLAVYKCPKYYEFVTELPMNAAGKVLKHSLRDRFAALGSRPRPVDASPDQTDRAS